MSVLDFAGFDSSYIVYTGGESGLAGSGRDGVGGCLTWNDISVPTDIVQFDAGSFGATGYKILGAAVKVGSTCDSGIHIVGFNHSSVGNIASLFTGAGGSIHAWVDGYGSQELVGFSTLAVGDWHWAEIRVEYNAAAPAGSTRIITINIDGCTATWTDGVANPTGSVLTADIYPNDIDAGAATCDIAIDDSWLVSGSASLGNRAITILRPQSDLSISGSPNWSCSTGSTRWSLVDDAAPNDDTDYIYTSSSNFNVASYFGMEDISWGASGDAVPAYRVYAWLKCVVGAGHTLAAQIRVGTTLSLYEAFPAFPNITATMSAYVKYSTEIRSTYRSGSLTIAVLNGLYVDIVSGLYYSTDEIRCTAICIEVIGEELSIPACPPPAIAPIFAWAAVIG